MYISQSMYVSFIMIYNCIWKFVLGTFGLYTIYETYLYIRYTIFYKLVLPVLWKPIVYKNYGKWAVITGCTDGIGKAFTHELARMGLDVILVSRSQKKLEQLAAEICSQYKVETKIIVADFRNIDEVIPTIKKQLQNEDVGILINNVGIALPVGSFLNCNKVRVNNLISVNMKSVLQMCSIVMNNMVEKRRGIIINVSSLLSTLPAAYIANVYGASKAFVLKFSTDLHDEYKDHGIIVHCLTTGPVVTKLFNINVNHWLTPTPERYVKSALKTIGMVKVTTGCTAHNFIEQVFKLVQVISPTLYTWVLYKTETALEKIALDNLEKRKITQ